MKKSMLGLSIALMGVLAASADAVTSVFPYGVQMTTRYTLVGPTTVASFTDPAVATGGGMQKGENLAVITSGVTSFTAVDEEDWDAATNSIDSAQAAFTLVSDTNGALAWKGLVGGHWVELTCVTVTPAEGEWTSKIEIDYSNPANKLVRYSLKGAGDDGFTALTYGGNAWLPLSGTSSQVESVKVYGYGTVSDVTGDCGTYTVPIATTENVSMSYDSFTVTATLPDSWKSVVTGAKVVVKDGSTVVKTVDAVVGADGVSCEVTNVTAGAEYTYEVQVTSATEPTPQTVKTSSVKLYGEIDWFGFAYGEFVKATPDDNIEITARKFASKENDVGYPLEGKITPATAANENSKIEVVTEIEVAGVTSYDDLPTLTDSPQLAVTLAKDSSGNRTWLYKVGTGAWTATSETVTGLTENGTYSVRVVFDYQSTNKTATVYVKKVENGVEATETKLFENVSLSGTKLAGASVMGGDVAYMNATFQTTAPAEVVPDGSTIDISKASAKVDLSKVGVGAYDVSQGTGDAKHHIRWTDANGKYATFANGKLTVTFDAPLNGLDSYMSYLLNLNTKDSASKPLVKSVQNALTGKLTFTLPDLSPKAESETGVKVRYQLQECATPTGTFAPVGDQTVDGTTINVDVPEGAVKYYKIGITAE